MNFPRSVFSIFSFSDWATMQRLVTRRLLLVGLRHASSSEPAARAAASSSASAHRAGSGSGSPGSEQQRVAEAISSAIHSRLPVTVPSKDMSYQQIEALLVQPYLKQDRHIMKLMDQLKVKDYKQREDYKHTAVLYE